MNSASGLFLPFGIGLVNGLRSFSAPAVVAWAAHLGWIHLSGFPVAFMGALWAVEIFTLGVLLETVIDQIPKHSDPYHGLSADGANRHGRSDRRVSWRGGWRVTVDWRNTRNGGRGGRSFWRLPGSGWIRAGAARPGFCDWSNGGFDCDWMWLVPGFEILILACSCREKRDGLEWEG